MFHHSIFEPLCEFVEYQKSKILKYVYTKIYIFSNFTVDIERDRFGWSNAVSGKFGRLIFPTQNKPTPLQINNPTQQIEILHSIHMQAYMFKLHYFAFVFF